MRSLLALSVLFNAIFCGLLAWWCPPILMGIFVLLAVVTGAAAFFMWLNFCWEIMR
jgi:hypothetical protein